MSTEPTATVLSLAGGLRRANIERGRGWYVVYADHIRITYLDAHVDDDAWAAFLDQTRHALSGLRRETYCELFDIPLPGALTATRRYDLAQLRNRFERRLHSATRAFALATASREVRGVSTALFWIAPPPFPCRSFARTQDALLFLASHEPRLDATRVEADYQPLRRELILECRQRLRLAA